MSTQAILCVDDEAIILMALLQELRSAFGNRYRYEHAFDAEKALEIIEQLTKDGITLTLVITDWLMPGMDGEKLLEIIHERYSDTKTILITGHADDEALQRMISDTRNLGVLRKPWISKQLTQLITDSLGSPE